MGIPLEEALRATTEAAALDFKAEFDPTQLRAWLELLKDIIAIANSGGGTILVGAGNDGEPTGHNVDGLLGIDPADFSNRIYKYTGQNFSDVELVPAQKGSHKLCAIVIGRSRIPIVFSRVGECELADSKKKTVFALGTVYFRHGAKSEPGTSDDLRVFLERELEAIRESWLEGIAKVVEAPPGSRVAILPPASTREGAGGSLPMTLTDDPNATPYYAVPLDSTHPHRQKEVIKEVNARLAGRRQINSHDVLCIRRVYQIQLDLNYCYTQNFASPRYSKAFVNWIVQSYERNESFFEETKAKYDEVRSRNGGNA